MNEIYAELGEDDRITLFSRKANGEPDETLWNDSYQIKMIPGKKWDRKAKRWTLPKSYAACIVLRELFGDRIVVEPELAAWARSERNRRDEVLLLREALSLDERSEFANDHDEILYPFQIPGRDFLVKARNALMGDQMGVGKSLQTLAAIRAVNNRDSRDVWGTGDLAGTGYVKQGAYPALIVCPNSLKRNWEREIKRWLPEANPFVIQGSAAKRRVQITEAAEAYKAIIIVNIEAMKLHSRLSSYGSTRLKRCMECETKTQPGTPDLKESACEVHEKELNRIPFRVCVLDEAHRVKDAQALQTRAIWNVFHGPTVEYRWALTGTPVANHPGDLWSIMHAIAPETYPAKSAFIDRYARIEYNHFGGMSIVGLKPDTKEEFFKILDPHFRRMIKADVLKQLPDKVFMRRDVEMSPKQAKAYKDIAEQLVTVLEDGTVLVANGNLAGATRLLQFASAYCEVDQGETPEDPATWLVSLTDTPKSSKIDELMSIIEDDPGKPMVIAAEHRQLIDLAAKRMTDAGIPFARVTGGVSADERDAAVQAFQDGKIDHLLFTYKAGGVGLNLTRADTMVRLQRSWSLIDNNQGVDRIHRIGSEVHDKVTIIDLVAAGTIEETQHERLYDKAERLEEIVRDRAKLLALGKTTDDLDAEAARIEATGLMGG
jgi:SNF2 family DNA or RNA helicase